MESDSRRITAERNRTSKVGWAYEARVRMPNGDVQTLRLPAAPPSQVFFQLAHDGAPVLARDHMTGASTMFTLAEQANGVSLVPASSKKDLLCNGVAVALPIRLSSHNIVSVNGLDVEISPTGEFLSERPASFSTEPLTSVTATAPSPKPRRTGLVVVSLVILVAGAFAVLTKDRAEPHSSPPVAPAPVTLTHPIVAARPKAAPTPHPRHHDSPRHPVRRTTVEQAPRRVARLKPVTERRRPAPPVKHRAAPPVKHRAAPKSPQKEPVLHVPVQPIHSAGKIDDNG